MRELRQKPSFKRCMVCKEAIISSRIYCKRLGEYVDDLVYCPHFEPNSTAEMQAIQ